MNAKIKLIFLSIFTVLIAIALTVSETYKQRAISDELTMAIRELQTNYNIVLHDYQVAAEAIKFSIFAFPEVKEILSKVAGADEEQKNVLRKELYALLKKDFDTYKKLGVKLILFTQPDNRVFLRMHKPDIYDDDISNVRHALATVNQSHQPMSGFEQGKISHAFRYIYPLFDSDDSYLGNLDISFSSERLQKTLDSVHNLHTHFLISKNVVDSRIWSVENVTSSYKPSREHSDYLVERIENGQHQLTLDSANNIFEKNRSYINQNIDKTEPFAVWGKVDSDVMVIAFLPISSIMSQGRADAYLVGYMPNCAIPQIENNYVFINIISEIIIGLVLLLIYTMLMKKELIHREHERYVKLMNLASDGILVMDLNGRLIEFSDIAQKMLGYTREEMRRLTIFDIDAKESSEATLKHLRDVPTEPVRFETLHRRKDGTLYDASVTTVKIRIDGYHYIYASVRDVTRQKKEEKEAREKLQRFIDAQDSIVVLTDGKHIKFANQTFYEFFGYSDLASFEKEYDCICDRFIEDDVFFHLAKVKPDEATWIESLLNLTGRQRIVSMQNAESTPYAFSVSISQYDEQSYVVSFTDISDTMIEKLQLKQQTLVDELTGAYNRVYFNQSVDYVVHRHCQNNFTTCVIFFDIDHFKQVNDTYGHDVGDDVLKKVVSLVQRYTRDDDKLIRWGGEEFVILTSCESMEGAYKNAEHIRSVIEQNDFRPVEKVTCSFGCALYDGHSDIRQTVKKADDALYEAKKSGRNRVVVSPT